MQLCIIGTYTRKLIFEGTQNFHKFRRSDEVKAWQQENFAYVFPEFIKTSKDCSKISVSCNLAEVSYTAITEFLSLIEVLFKKYGKILKHKNKMYTMEQTLYLSLC